MKIKWNLGRDGELGRDSGGTQKMVGKWEAIFLPDWTRKRNYAQCGKIYKNGTYLRHIENVLQCYDNVPDMDDLLIWKAVFCSFHLCPKQY